MSALGTLLFVVAILFSIGLHEFGHFITAKRFGIKVHQFFIGFGPKVWSVQRGETEYGVKSLPLGGFVRIAGMNPYEEIAPEDRDRVFKAKKPWKRAIVLSAGSLTHFILAFVILFGILTIAGVPNPDRPTLTVRSISLVHEGKPSPAVEAGIREGDRIVAIDGTRVRAWQEAVRILQANPGEQVTLTVVRDGRETDLRTTLAARKPNGERGGFLGVGPEYTLERRAPLAATVESGKTIAEWSKQSVLSLGQIFSPETIGRLFSIAAGSRERGPEDPATVVGLSRAAGGLAEEGEFAMLFTFLAVFNVFIGVVNLLPLPPLDGGHLAVLAYEKVRKRDVDMRRLLPVTAAVIAIFGSLFVLLLYLDIVHPPTLSG